MVYLSLKFSFTIKDSRDLLSLIQTCHYTKKRAKTVNMYVEHRKQPSFTLEIQEECDRRTSTPPLGKSQTGHRLNLNLLFLYYYQFYTHIPSS